MGSARAGRDLRQSQVLVQHEVPEAAERQRFTCSLCKRALPEDQFHVIGRGASRTRLGKVFFLYPECRRCYRQSRSEISNHPLWSPELHTAAERTTRHAYQGSSKRGLVFAITAVDVIRLYYAQEGRCALSGVLMTFSAGSKAFPRANRCAMSVDRIDSGANYTRDNIQLLCWTVNAMKSAMSDDEFRFWCAQVVLHNAEDAEDDEGKN
jgi:hypothetical protein